jgi:hypothetical protein
MLSYFTTKHTKFFSLSTQRKSIILLVRAMLKLTIGINIKQIKNQ